MFLSVALGLYLINIFMFIVITCHEGKIVIISIITLSFIIVFKKALSACPEHDYLVYNPQWIIVKLINTTGNTMTTDKKRK